MKINEMELRAIKLSTEEAKKVLDKTYFRFSEMYGWEWIDFIPEIEKQNSIPHKVKPIIPDKCFNDELYGIAMSRANMASGALYDAVELLDILVGRLKDEREKEIKKT